MQTYKIIIITSFFEEKYGYQEIHMANTLSEIGHDVMVLTSDRSPFSKDRLKSKENKKYSIVRIDRNIRIIDTLFPLKLLRIHIARFNPDIALIVHIGHGLPYYSLKNIDKKTKKVSFFGDLTRQHSSFRRKLIQGLLKDRWYYKTFQHCDIVVANTNETVDILSKKAKWESNLTQKIFRSSLGFDKKKFFYSNLKRPEVRNKYNIPDDQIVFCTTTKIVKRKPILEWISPILGLLAHNSNITYCLAGFMDDLHSEETLKQIKKQYSGSNLLLLPLLPFTDLNDLYNAVDYSIWFDASITIQESMGTGLKVIIPNSKRVDHLVNDQNGYFFDSLKEIPKIISLLEGGYDRQKIADINSQLSYDSIITEIIEKTQNV